MADFIITCPACGGFLDSDPPEENIKTIPYNYMLDGVIYKYDGEIDPPEVFEKIKKGLIPDIAPISIPKYTNFFTAILNSGKDILHIDFSENYSPNCKYAREAADALLKSFPDRKIRIIDSKRLGLGIFALAKKASSMLKLGKSFDNTTEEIKNLTKHNTDLLIARNLLFLKDKKYISFFQKKSGDLKHIEIILSFNPKGALMPITKTAYPQGADIALKEIRSEQKFISDDYYLGCESNSEGIKSCMNHSLILDSHIVEAADKEHIQSPDIFTISKVGLNSFEILGFT